ncbi:hypothetical protein [Serratia fonticola]|uniref:hypothetical protein n=1 Tax=Serratia fonticola TaxID=47917 RepID=UPI0021ADB51D|nr:hypothetical protein [Serratia fonticola]
MDVQALPLASYYPISDGMTWDYTLEDERYLTIKSLRIHKLFRSTSRNSSYTNAFVLLNIDSQALSTTIPETFCLPPSSDSLLVAVQKHIAGNYLPLIRNLTLRPVSTNDKSQLVLEIGTCTGNGNNIIMGAYVADTHTKFNCAIKAPDTVAFRSDGPVRRTEYFFVSCIGEGQADVRLRVLGTTTITLDQGVSVSTLPPAQYITIYAGESKILPVTFDLKTNAAKPGQYSGTFVYALEYL